MTGSRSNSAPADHREAVRHFIRAAERAVMLDETAPK
jgi:hypothetical protein